SDVQLVAKIYYNRGVALLQHSAFAAALPLLMRASELDRDDPAARRNTLACLNNWAVSECHCGRFERALDLLTQGRSLAPNHDDFADNEVYVYFNWARKLCAEESYPEALDVLDAACRRHPSVMLFREGRATVSAAWDNSRSSNDHGNPRRGVETIFSNAPAAACWPSSGTTCNPCPSRNTPDPGAL
ncbi:MAG: tetratricopeptide repeat protein, partial [Planctomycetes bacterium]|nr:tetratricopeptide repeat protein [Planctomycetota bacterium]